ncbi:MAG: nitrilase-related carbon-nitrogen hydrolase, partial [Anaerolineales bacterium]
KERDRVSASLFRTQAEAMARRYQTIFSRLARENAVTVVAGSIPLPAPRVEAGQVIAGRGPIYAISALFRPDGTADPRLVHKVIPIDSESPFVTAGAAADLPVFDTPAGRLGVLICADSWYPAPYAQMKAGGAELLAVPSFVSEAGSWHKPWGGYNGAPAPADIDPGDVGRLTEGQAWRKYALAGRLAESGARHGINVFLRGELWDLGADNGASLAIRTGEIIQAGTGPTLLNLWL